MTNNVDPDETACSEPSNHDLHCNCVLILD